MNLHRGSFYSQETATHGIVINADPNNPPYCLLGLTKIWKDLPVHVSVHVHSSIVTLPEQVKTFEMLQKLNSQSKSRVNVTLVWKDGKIGNYSFQNKRHITILSPFQLTKTAN